LLALGARKRAAPAVWALALPRENFPGGLHLRVEAGIACAG